MKKLILLFVLSIQHTITAQNSIGIELHPNLSRINYSNSTNFENKKQMLFNYGARIYYLRELNKSIHITAGFGYENKGTKYQYQETDANGVDIGLNTYKIRLSYIRGDLGLRYNIKSVFISAGGFYDFLQTEKHYKGSKEVIIKNSSFNNYDYGINLGLGAKIKLNEKLKIIPSLNNDFGMANILKTGQLNSSAKTNTLKLGIGLEYAF